MNAEQKVLGSNIRDLRTKANLSQEELADITNLHRTYIGGIERGERNVSLNNIVKIARALKIDPSYLLHGIK